jgi:hypothetical protein
MMRRLTTGLMLCFLGSFFVWLATIRRRLGQDVATIGILGGRNAAV